MKEAFEKIKERLEAEAEEHRKYWSEFDDEDSFGAMNATFKALSIVSEVEAEYGNGKTNADRIRSMSDEQLAEFLPIVSNMFCRPTDDCMKMICNRGECEKTKDCALNWLKSPTTD